MARMIAGAVPPRTGFDLAVLTAMKTNRTLDEIRVEFCDHSDQPLCEGFQSPGGIVPIPAVGDTFQGRAGPQSIDFPTYVVERRHFQIAPEGLTVRVYGRDIQVTGGL
jgi:hypothetical protein